MSACFLFLSGVEASLPPHNNIEIISRTRKEKDSLVTDERCLCSFFSEEMKEPWVAF